LFQLPGVAGVERKLGLTMVYILAPEQPGRLISQLSGRETSG